MADEIDLVMNLYTFGNLTIDDIVYHETKQFFSGLQRRGRLVFGNWVPGSGKKPVNMVVRIGRDYQRQNIKNPARSRGELPPAQRDQRAGYSHLGAV